MARKSRKNVGIIGLGIIGTRVAQALRAGGFHVFVWNRTAKPAPNFLGSPVDLAEICDLIQIFVSDSQALFQVLESFGGALTENHVVVCSSTVGPEATIEASRLVKAKGARFLDAPFTGSRLAAEKSQLRSESASEPRRSGTREANTKPRRKVIHGSWNTTDRA